jgi:caffeoyl-CoA O-methyltransferase
MQIIDSAIEFYAEQHTSEESALIQKLVNASEEELEHTDMLSGRVVGRFLALMIQITAAKRVLEIGTFSGYSAHCMAEALPADGELITCEYNRRYEALARSFFEKSEHGQKIRLIMGPALKTLDELDGKFDLIFLDADKVNYPEYYRKILPLLDSGGLLVVDNVLWSGAVLDPNDEKAKAIVELNKIIADDNRVEQVMLTVRDGLTLARKN